MGGGVLRRGKSKDNVQTALRLYPGIANCEQEHRGGGYRIGVLLNGKTDLWQTNSPGIFQRALNKGGLIGVGAHSTETTLCAEICPGRLFIRAEGRGGNPKGSKGRTTKTVINKSHSHGVNRQSDAKGSIEKRCRREAEEGGPWREICEWQQYTPGYRQARGIRVATQRRSIRKFQVGEAREKHIDGTGGGIVSAVRSRNRNQLKNGGEGPLILVRQRRETIVRVGWQKIPGISRDRSG